MGCSASSNSNSASSSSTKNPTSSPPAASPPSTHTSSSAASGGGGGKIGQSAEATSKTKEQVFAYADLNPTCADCNAPTPTWASINNGVLICTACSGVHRSLGVEISFVQSLKLDDWTPEALSQLQSKGPNSTANDTLLEYHVPAAFAKPSPHSSRDVREKYIQAKYVDKAFAPSMAVEGGGSKPMRERLAPIQHVDNEGPGNNSNSSTKKDESSIGEVEFIGILVVNLISCKNLVNADWSISGTDVSDPYVVFTLGRQSITSKKINDDLNPVFNETLMLSWDGRSSLHVQVMDRDQFKTDDPLGDVSIDVKTLLLPSSNTDADAAAASVVAVAVVADGSAVDGVAASDGNPSSSSSSVVVASGSVAAAANDASGSKKLDLPLENIEHGSVQLELSFMPLG